MMAKVKPLKAESRRDFKAETEIVDKVLSKYSEKGKEKQKEQK